MTDDQFTLLLIVGLTFGMVAIGLAFAFRPRKGRRMMISAVPYRHNLDLASVEDDEFWRRRR